MNSNKPILALMDEFLANKDCSENTRKKYRETLHLFIGWLTRNANVSEPMRCDIIGYKKWLVASDRTAATIDNYLASVRQFFRWLEESGIYDNVAAGIKSPPIARGYRKGYLKPDQVSKLLSSVNRTTLLGKRNYAIINLMVRTGLRSCEVARISIGDLLIEGKGWVVSIQGKGRRDKDAVMGVSSMVVIPIKEYIYELDNAKEQSPMFQNHSYRSYDTRVTSLLISKIVKKQLRAIGIDSPKLSCHALRHTAAITAINSGASLNEVQAMLRHKKIETTQIYLSAIEEENMRKGIAVRRLDNAYNTRKKKPKRNDSDNDH